MSITGLNPEKCAARNRIAARRDGVNAHPIRFLRGPVPVGQGVTSAVGTLPMDDAAAMTLINGLRPEGAEPLTEDQVWIHRAEAANSTFIGDRYAFLSTKTLKNIARDAQAGFAFMNSHRTGGLSHDSELPYGRTFAGRYEKASDGSERALIGFYMMRGQYPNGQSGPSTDALHAGIDGGTIFDVSVGLWGGMAVCDVCGGDVTDWADCRHIPGTDYNMTDEEMAAQRDRGVGDGLASYTLDDCHCNETSAVYDGAVTGAGFNKALSAMKGGRLSGESARQVQAAYGSLLGKGDHDLPNTLSALVDRITEALGLRSASGKDAADDPAALGNSAAVAPDTEAPSEPAEEATDAVSEETPAPAAAEVEADAPEPSPAPGSEHPVLEAARAAGIGTAEEFAAVLRAADDGKAYVASEREKAKKLAVIAFGNSTPAERLQVAEAHALIDAAELGQVKSLNAQYERFAEKLGLRNAEGTAMPRRSAAAELPTFAVDAQQAPAPSGSVLLPTGEVYEKRRQETLASTRPRR